MLNVDILELAYLSDLDPDDFSHWRELVAAGSGYTRITIPQTRRRPREVLRPSVGLDRLLKQLLRGLKLASSYTPADTVHGFVKGRDIATNAASHLDQDVVLRVDLKDFFGTIDRTMLVPRLVQFGFDGSAADAIAGVTLVDGSLPQGFSTSPYLSNLVFSDTDSEMSLIVADTSITYTRYVDDLIFSGPLLSVHDDFFDSVELRLKHCGWSVNGSKTRFMRRGKSQYVTGLYVGESDGPHIPRAMKRLLRREVYYAKKFGVRDARLRSPTPIEPDRINGWVHYAAHVDRVFGANLRDSWNEVASRRSASYSSSDWDRILEDIDFPKSL